MVNRIRLSAITVLTLILGAHLHAASAQAPSPPGIAPEKIIVDTDIGTDIDDAFAVALALGNPELDILGVTTVSGDVEARARIVDRMFRDVNRADIPVATGIPSALPWGLSVDQQDYGNGVRVARSSDPDQFCDLHVARSLNDWSSEITCPAHCPDLPRITWRPRLGGSLR